MAAVVLAAGLAALAALGGAGLAEAAPSNRGAKLLAELQDAYSPSGFVVRLGADNYTKYLEGPRPYHLVMMYTAADAQYGCQACVPTSRQMILASKAYRTSLEPGAERNIIFGVADIRYNGLAFQLHGLQSVPHVVVWPPTTERTKVPKGPGAAGQLPIPPEMHVPVDDSGLVSARTILERLPGGENMRIVLPAVERAAYASAWLLLLALLAGNKANLLFFFRRWFWRLASLAIYGVAISGFVLCIIKTPPTYSYTRDGQPSIFSGSGGHDQYVLEGGVIGMLNLMAGGAVMLAVASARSRNFSTVSKAVLAAVALAAFGAAYLRIAGYYMDKTRWYKVSEVVPAQYSRALTRAGTQVLLYASKAWSFVAPVAKPALQMLSTAGAAAGQGLGQGFGMVADAVSKLRG